jgi:hypothetical protein
LKAARHLSDLERTSTLIVSIAKIVKERTRFGSVGEIRHLGQLPQGEGFASEEQGGFEATASAHRRAFVRGGRTGMSAVTLLQPLS